jgi:hypothetical protein
MNIREYLLMDSIQGAFWISPRGEIISSGINHIDTVISNSNKFGFTEDEIRKTYEKYGEILTQEGKAREEIIKKLIDKGWIRIRRYPNKFWSININRLNKKNKDFIQDWAEKILKGIHGFREQDKYMPVNIQTIKGKSFSYDVDKLSHDILYKMNESKDFELTVCSIQDI